MKIANTIKNKIRKWLGLGEIFMGIDIGSGRKDHSVIVIASKLGNGQVRIIDARFDSVREIEKLTRELKQRYDIPNENIYSDAPWNFKF